MKLGTLFSGIGAPEQAANRVYGEDLEMVFACEWDKFARQSFKAIYGNKEESFFEDVNDLDGTSYKGKVDLIVGGSPCQAFSIAGLRKGVEDIRGQLIYQFIRIIDEVQPPHFIYENVKGMMSIEKGETIREFLTYLAQTGYAVTMDVVNTKWYGVPQNRERIFIVGQKLQEGETRIFQRPSSLQINNKKCIEIINGLIDSVPDFHYLGEYIYPKPTALDKRLKDILEPNVDEKYYLSHKMISYLDKASRAIKPFDGTQKHAPCVLASYYKTPTDGFYVQEGVVGMLDIKGNECIRRVYGVDGTAPCLQTMQCGNREPKICEIRTDEGIRFFKDDVCGCLRTTDTCGDKAVIESDYRIRKLTPLECWRLQDFPDEAHEKAKEAGVSDSQRYKQAGNSMTVKVVELLMKQLEIMKTSQFVVEKKNLDYWF